MAQSKPCRKCSTPIFFKKLDVPVNGSSWKLFEDEALTKEHVCPQASKGGGRFFSKPKTVVVVEKTIYPNYNLSTTSGSSTTISGIALSTNSNYRVQITKELAEGKSEADAVKELRAAIDSAF